MTGDGLSLASFTNHKQLGQDSHRLQVDREGPQDLEGREIVVDEESETSDGHDEELHTECIVVAVVGRLKLVVHQIYCGVRRTDEDTLHAAVVQRDKVGEQIQVTCGEHQGKHDLRLSRETST